MRSRALRLSLILVFAALSIVGRLALVWLPNVSLSFLALAVAGLVYGVRVGAAVGFLGRLGSDLLITGFNPVFVPMVLVETAVGAALGLLGHAIDFGQRRERRGVWLRVALFDLGVVLTLAFSVLSDSVTWVFYNLLLPNAPDAARGSIWTTFVVLGLAFNVVPAIVHGIIFATTVPPILRGLRETGLVGDETPSVHGRTEETTASDRGVVVPESTIK